MSWNETDSGVKRAFTVEKELLQIVGKGTSCVYLTRMGMY
jgi:hypothetical protein